MFVRWRAWPPINSACSFRSCEVIPTLSLPITRRAPGHRAAVDPIKRPTVHSGDANRQYRETGPPYPALVDAPCAGSVRPSIRKDAFASHGTSHHRNTHITESLEVRYPWHPLHGQRVWIYERFVKGGVASFRCGLGEFAGDRSMDLPQWMLDAVACCDLRLTPTPVVSCEALAALKVLIARRGEAQTVAFVEARHLDPSPLGDADAKLAEDHPICALSPAEPVSKLGQSVCADQTAVDTTSGPIDARASRKGNRRKTVRGGRS
jgi:hypothetical protein